MPDQSWFPLVVSIGLLIGAYGMTYLLPLREAIGSAAVLFPLAGLAVIVFGIYAWALEGPGGYHIHPGKKSK